MRATMPTAVLVVTAALASPPAFAQDLPTDQLEQHADVVRQDAHLRSSLRHSMARRGDRAKRATPAQAAACAKKAEFSAEYGADDPRVKRLYELCRGVGL